MLFHKSNIPLAVIEAKDNIHAVADGIQQALGYAELLDVPFVFSSNGDAFVFHDKTAADGVQETELPMTEFPSPQTLWAKYRAWRGLADNTEEIFLQDYYEAGGKHRAITSKTPSIAFCAELRKATIAFYWSWQPAPAKPIPPFRLSGGYGSGG